MTVLLHTATPETYPKTTCGLRLERGVHRCDPGHLPNHLERDGVEACPDCSKEQT